MAETRWAATVAAGHRTPAAGSATLATAGNPGRLAFVDLWPFSMVERCRASGDFLSTVFDDPRRLLVDSDWTRQRYVECVVAGGYPEVLRMPSGLARRAWHDGYLHTVISRDIQNFATITRGDAVQRLLGLVAARAGGPVSLTDLATSVELARDTTRNYLAYLDVVYLTARVPAWSTNLSARFVKAPKLYPTDSGLAAHLLQVDAADLADPAHPAFGSLLEIFAATELLKALATTGLRVGMFHLRSGRWTARRPAAETVA